MLSQFILNSKGHLNSICLKRFPFFKHYRFLSNSSSPDDDLDVKKALFDKNSNRNRVYPKVTRVSFSPRSIRRRSLSKVIIDKTDDHSNSSGPVILKLPILEVTNHIFPCFSKMVEKNPVISSIIGVVSPKAQKIGMFIRRPDAETNHELTHLYDVGTLVSYDHLPQKLGEKSIVMVTSHKRIKLLRPIPSAVKNDVLSYAECQVIPERPVQYTNEIKVLCYQVMDFIKNLQQHYSFNNTFNTFQGPTLDPVYWSYIVCDFAIMFEPSRLQKVLDQDDITERLRMSVKILSEELELLNISSHMNKKMREIEMKENHFNNLMRMKQLVDSSINQFSRGNVVRGGSGEPLKGIGGFFNNGTKSENSFEKKIRDRLKNLTLPPAVATIIEEEMGRFSSLDKSNAEYNIIQNYLDHITLIPWGVQKPSKTALTIARDILDEDHFGLEEVKDSILEHIAINYRLEKPKGRILCLIGPPGVGKTSVVKSIARALDREYVRISVGGIDDTSEIKGHRRTYVGAYPGKIIKALQTAKSMNPVVCIDEIDKISRNNRGDPVGPLLEAFDPEQNANFTDCYIDSPCDLSRVIFVCTANTASSINLALLDRMELINISGYSSEEKQQIINRFIIPSIVKSFDLTETFGKDIIIDPDVIVRLTDEYFIEAGVRKVKACIEKMIRKSVKEIQLGIASQIRITLDNITHYAGYPDIHLRKQILDESVVGLITGLSAADNYSVGFTMDIECDFVVADKNTKEGQIISTGLAGKSLSESSLVAFVVVKKMLQIIDPQNTKLQENITRIHFLDAGTKKDGPSAGVSIFCAVLSQALGIPVSRNLAMTGEITLKGKVTAVGKIREKIAAAARHGIRNVIIPLENKYDYDRVPNSLKSKINITFVSNVDELIKAAFPNLSYSSTSDAKLKNDNSINITNVDVTSN